MPSSAQTAFRHSAAMECALQKYKYFPLNLKESKLFRGQRGKVEWNSASAVSYYILLNPPVQSLSSSSRSTYKLQLHTHAHKFLEPRPTAHATLSTFKFSWLLKTWQLDSLTTDIDLHSFNAQHKHRKPSKCTESERDQQHSIRKGNCLFSVPTLIYRGGRTAFKSFLPLLRGEKKNPPLLLTVFLLDAIWSMRNIMCSVRAFTSAHTVIDKKLVLSDLLLTSSNGLESIIYYFIFCFLASIYFFVVKVATFWGFLQLLWKLSLALSVSLHE